MLHLKNIHNQFCQTFAAGKMMSFDLYVKPACTNGLHFATLPAGVDPESSERGFGQTSAYII